MGKQRQGRCDGGGGKAICRCFDCCVNSWCSWCGGTWPGESAVCSGGGWDGPGLAAEEEIPDEVKQRHSGSGVAVPGAVWRMAPSRGS
jgi:hypothetical protein